MAGQAVDRLWKLRTSVLLLAPTALALSVHCAELPEETPLRTIRAELAQLRKLYPLLGPQVTRVLSAADAKVAQAGRAGSVREKRRLLREAIDLLEGPVTGRLREIHAALLRVRTELDEIGTFAHEDPTMSEQLQKEKAAAQKALAEAKEQLVRGPVPEGEEEVAAFLLAISEKVVSVDRALARWIKTARAARSAKSDSTRR